MNHYQYLNVVPVFGQLGMRRQMTANRLENSAT